MGIEEGTCWDEHWVLYGNQLDNNLYLKKRKKEIQAQQLPSKWKTSETKLGTKVLGTKDWCSKGVKQRLSRKM